MLLPLIYLSQTNMKRAQKISASVTFAIGLVSITVSFARWIVVLSVFQGVGEAALTTAGELDDVIPKSSSANLSCRGPGCFGRACRPDRCHPAVTAPVSAHLERDGSECQAAGDHDGEQFWDQFWKQFGSARSPTGAAQEGDLGCVHAIRLQDDWHGKSLGPDLANEF